MEAGPALGAWLRCYRCWSTNLEVQVHYEGIHRIDPTTGEQAEAGRRAPEAVVQCLDCMHDQPHLGFLDKRVQPIEDRWERMVAGQPWVASCEVTVDAESVESCSGPDAADDLSFAAFGDHGTREFFTHVPSTSTTTTASSIFLLVELYARSQDEALETLSTASQGTLVVSSLAEESRPPRRPAPTPTDARGRGRRRVLSSFPPNSINAWSRATS